MVTFTKSMITITYTISDGSAFTASLIIDDKDFNADGEKVLTEGLKTIIQEFYRGFEVTLTSFKDSGREPSPSPSP